MGLGDFFRRWSVSVPVFSGGSFGSAIEGAEQHFRADQFLPNTEMDAWWYISYNLSDGETVGRPSSFLEVHDASGFEQRPYVIGPGGHLRMHHKFAPEITLRNRSASTITVTAVVVLTSDPYYEHETQGTVVAAV